MQDYLTFETREEAAAEIMTMRGWGSTVAVKVTITDWENGCEVEKWAIRVNGDKYLRSDGFVR